MEPRPAVFLDRDGVLNRAIVRDGKPFSPMQLSEFRLLPGVVETCDRLTAAGLPIVVVTNQPEVARGRLSMDVLDDMHAELWRRLCVTEVIVCPHDSADLCSCRKPLPGMILDAAQRHNIDLSRSVMVGDRTSDIKAGQAAGCMTIRIGNGYRDEDDVTADGHADSLQEACPLILQFILQLTR
jgi:D-glycero-D-manno-heptose 1,7-bisphosphate phosphatase